MARPASNPFEALAQGANMLLAGLQTQAQAFMSSHAQVFANINRSAQQAQAGFQRGMSEFIASAGATAAKPMLAVQDVAKGAGITPTQWYADESPAAVRERKEERKEWDAPLSKATAAQPYAQAPSVQAATGFTASPGPKAKPQPKKMKTPLF